LVWLFDYAALRVKSEHLDLFVNFITSSKREILVVSRLFVFPALLMQSEPVPVLPSLEEFFVPRDFPVFFV